jgi:hypothetical protein
MLRMYRCSDAVLIDTILYNPVIPAPIVPPYVVLEAIIDFNLYPEDQYFFVMCLQSTNLIDGLLTIESNSITVPGTYVFSLGGTPEVSDIVSVTYSIPFISSETFTVRVLPGWEMADVINALFALISASDVLSDVSIVGNGISVTAGILLQGSVTVNHYEIINASISEKVQTKTKWDNTILINSGNSINMPLFFFSTGIRQILRLEGLVKKLQPSINTIIADEESGNTQLVYSQVARKRIIRFGTAYGLPDFLYLKVSDSLTLDELVIEGVSYVLDSDEKIQPSDDIDGHPLYYYNVSLTLSINPKGYVFGDGSTEAEREGVVIVVDATAFGLPSGSIMQIELD